MTFYFDMDGTLVDFYGVPNWLDFLNKYDVTPYKVAVPLQNLSQLAKTLNKLRAYGHRIGIISWSSKHSTKAFDADIKRAKENWLKKHLPSVTWDEVHIVPYGTNKYEIAHDKNGILFDDEERNIKEWKNNKAKFPSVIMEVLKEYL